MPPKSQLWIKLTEASFSHHYVALVLLILTLFRLLPCIQLIPRSLSGTAPIFLFCLYKLFLTFELSCAGRDAMFTLSDGLVLGTISR